MRWLQTIPSCSNLLLYRFLLMVDVQIMSDLIFPTETNLESMVITGIVDPRPFNNLG